MTNLDRLLNEPPYALPRDQKHRLLAEELQLLTAFHSERCEPFGRIVSSTKPPRVGGIADTPMVPARLFKTVRLQSVSDVEVKKVLTSSGTTAQSPSRVAVDAATSGLQVRGLAAIMKSYIGAQRLPMLVIDAPATARAAGSLSARGAGLVGLANFGRDHAYALDDEMRLNTAAVVAFAEKYKKQPVLIFGFTFMVWRYFYAELLRLGVKLSLEHGWLFHGGGWKALEASAVTNDQFKDGIRAVCGIERVHNFYGMVEQLGSIYVECEQGYLHSPNFAEILVRKHDDWTLVPRGTEGVLQTLSVLPRSYPGHSILTEDLGTIHGVDDCACGRMGTYFTVHGRIPQSEVRGCSDVHGQKVADATDSGVSVFVPHRFNVARIEEVVDAEMLKPVAPEVSGEVNLEVLADLSRRLLGSPQVKAYPELVALGFWLRKANLQSIMNQFRGSVGEWDLAMPRGLAVHIAPANVDAVFVYSWALSLLAGNANILRISTQMTAQLEVLLQVIRDVASDPRWAAFARRNAVVTYPRNDEMTAVLSKQADVRVLWGGDATVQSVRMLATKPGAVDITFPDRTSACVVNAVRYGVSDEREAADAAQRFYGDSYTFQQMACSSPRVVYFVGEQQQCVCASNRFWGNVSLELRRRGHSEPPSQSMNKLVAAQQYVAEQPGRVVLSPMRSDSATVVRVDASEVVGCDNFCGGGFFLECFVSQLADLQSLVRPNHQTLTYTHFSREEMRDAASQGLCVNGILRIVPVGQALSFMPIWDGHVLLEELTRRVVVA